MNFSWHKIQKDKDMLWTKDLVFLDEVAELNGGITRSRAGWLKPKKAPPVNSKALFSEY